jgi:hypothetical protein
MQDFVDTPTRINRKLRGIQSDPATITYIGKGRFTIIDDTGQNCVLPIAKLYYSASAPVKILSPQHIDKMWRQENQNNKFEATINNDGCVVSWQRNNQLHSKLIKINKNTGIPICKTAPGYKNATKFFANNAIMFDDERGMIAALTTYENSETQQSDTVEDNQPTRQEQEDTQIFFHDEIKVTKSDDQQPSSTATEMMLHLHCKLGHLSFTTMRNMAKAGQLPRQIIKCREPKCASCMFGLATRRAWRTKSPVNNIRTSRHVTRPGDCVSIDQFESPVPGLVAQIKGNPTVQRYTRGTVFVDHFSDATYVHFQKGLTASETILAKEAYESWVKTHVVSIRHYHADNVRFSENAFVKHIQANGQTITYCCVNAHFQNGRAERKIRTLQDRARCQIIHAKTRWPQAITTNLWPYAMKNVVHIHNDVCYKENNKTRMEVFANTPVRPNLQNHHHFGVPVYVLDDAMQRGIKISKWATRARVGIYLGKLPRHARSVGLVLNPRTGNLSPQYHIKYDDLFETVKGIIDESFDIWKSKCGFYRG